jgi:hypothetical protein
MIKRSTLNELLFISFFLIFIRILPISVETQPIISFLVSCVFFVSVSKKNDFIKTDVFFVFLLGIILISYTCYQILFLADYNSIIELFKYAIGPIIFLAIRSNKYSISFDFFKKLIIGISILALISLLLPNIYSIIFGNLIPRFVENIGSDVRGIVVLTPEPSYFAVFQIILLITIEKALSQYESENCNTYTRKQLFYLKCVVIFISILTKSALVILYIVIFILPDFKKISLKKVLLGFLVIIPLLSLTIYLFFSENRLFDVIALIYTLVHDQQFDWMYFLFTQESSGGTRIIVNFLAIASIFIYPFGSGLGTFASMLNIYGNHYNMDLSTHEVLGSDAVGKIYPQTYFANLCNDIGIFALILFPIIRINNAKDSSNFILKRNLCLILMILFQSQITNPAFWYLIAISKIGSDEKIIQ